MRRAPQDFSEPREDYEMSGRSNREAKLRALAEGKYGAVVISEMGGRKKDRKKELNDQIRGKLQDGSLESMIRKALTNPDSGPRAPDLRKGGPMAASMFPLTAGSLVAAKLRGLDVEETPEGAYAIQRDEPSEMDQGRTLGEAMFLNPQPTQQMERGAYEHELGHVSQGRDWGILHGVENARQQFQAMIEGTDPQDTRFENEALRRGRELTRPLR